MLMFPMIIMYEVTIDRRLSTNTRTRARAPGKKMKMNPAGQARSDQVMSYSAPDFMLQSSLALLLALFVCSLSYFCSPYTGSATMPLVYGMTRLMFYVLRIHLHTHACVHRYLDWTGN